jgi:DHA1 family multidrug resistance protein-like MFS transporter
MTAPAHPWKRNLAVIWLSQVLSIAGFSFALPFTPYFMQEMGVPPGTELNWWVALASAAPAFTLAVFAPVWGVLGDRFGKRLMLLRANFAAFLVISLMGLATAPWQLVLLRLTQGMFTGTVSASQALIASGTPDKHTGFALGLVNSALFTGVMAGSALGGVVAEAIGYANAFFIAGGMMLISALLVLWGAVEQVDRFAARQRTFNIGFKIKSGRVLLRSLKLIFIITALMSMARMAPGGYLPLFIQQLLGTLTGAARFTGLLNMAVGGAGMFSGLLYGRLYNRLARPALLGSLGALLAALLNILVSRANSIPLLFSTAVLAAFCGVGLDVLMQTWISRRTSANRRGTAFGLLASVRAAGWMIGPVIASPLVSLLGYRAVYVLSAGLFALAALAFYYVSSKACSGDGSRGSSSAVLKRLISAASSLPVAALLLALVLSCSITVAIRAIPVLISLIPREISLESSESVFMDSSV